MVSATLACGVSLISFLSPGYDRYRRPYRMCHSGRGLGNPAGGVTRDSSGKLQRLQSRRPGRHGGFRQLVGTTITYSDMNIASPFIAKAVELALEDGNSVETVSDGWTRVKQVVHLKGMLSPQLRSMIAEQVPSLRYWSAERTPQNPASEGFICEHFGVGLSFPR